MYRLSYIVYSLFILCLSCVIYSPSTFGDVHNNITKDAGFSYRTLQPASGQKPDSIVVLFHGYGDTGENFILLGPLLGKFLPNTLFVAIDGPIECQAIPSGKQWLKTSGSNKPQLLVEIK